MKGEKIKKILLILTIVACFPFSRLHPANRVADGFALFNTKGKLVTLSSQLSTKPLILAFFASYCVPCKREIPQLIDIESKYSNKVKLLLINIDKEGKEKALSFLDAIGVNRECLLDIYQQTAKKYIPKLKIPAFFLVNKRRRILYKSIGDNIENIKKLENIIKRMR